MSHKIVLYERDNFGGKFLELTTAAPRLGAFTYVTSSIKVICGTWHVHGECDLQGSPLVVHPGEYPNPASWGGWPCNSLSPAESDCDSL